MSRSERVSLSLYIYIYIYTRWSKGWKKREERSGYAVHGRRGPKGGKEKRRGMGGRGMWG